MTNGSIGKIFLIFLYLLLILLIPLFLDYLFHLTVRKKRRAQIMTLAEQKSQQTGKALVIFDNRFGGKVNTDGKNEVFSGDIEEIVQQMANNSCVIVVHNTLEYIDDPNKIIKQINDVSGGDYYIVNVEQNSPKVFYDYKIKNLMNKSFHLPGEAIEWKDPNGLQKKIQTFYYNIFRMAPLHHNILGT